MPKSNKERLADLRKRRSELGQKRREYYLTDDEKIVMDSYFRRIRKEAGMPDSVKRDYKKKGMR